MEQLPRGDHITSLVESRVVVSWFSVCVRILKTDLFYTQRLKKKKNVA